MSLIPTFKIGMWNGWLFMSFFIIHMGIMFLAGKQVWERSHVPKEIRKTKFEKSLGTINNFLWWFMMLYSIFLPLRLGAFWFYVGLFLFIFGAIFMTMATFNFVTTPPNEMIKKGVYQFSRHPMYFSALFICLGTGIATGSWLFILIILVISFLFNKEAVVEERYCLDKYGQEYQEYKNSVPRWFGLPQKTS
jgi:protein-S-isoprenylcysteine O-methyltransferase Ste14